MDRGNTICPFHHSSNGRGVGGAKKEKTALISYSDNQGPDQMGNHSSVRVFIVHLQNQ